MCQLPPRPAGSKAWEEISPGIDPGGPGWRIMQEDLKCRPRRELGALRPPAGFLAAASHCGRLAFQGGALQHKRYKYRLLNDRNY